MDKARELGKSMLFRELPDSELDQLASIAVEHSFNAGDKLASEGDDSLEILVVAMGSVQLSKRLDSGDEEEMLIIGSGSQLGESCLIEDDAKMAVSATALEKTFVLGIPATSFHELCEARPIIGYHAYRAVVRAMGRRGRRLLQDAAHYKHEVLQH